MNKKLKIFFNYFVGPILFVWLSYSMYRQIQNQTDLHQSWSVIKSAFSGPQLGKLVLVIFFMFINWGLEARKWQLLVSGIEKVSFGKAYRAILSGQAFAFNSFNRIGESAARAVFLEEGNRIRGIVLSIVGSMSLIIVTFVLGLISLIYFKFNILDTSHQVDELSMFWLNGLIYVIAPGILLFICIYFGMSVVIKLLERIPLIAKYSFFVQKLEDFHWKELTRILSLSFFRYVVFIIQYLLLLQVFEVNISLINAACMVSLMFLILAVIPSIALAELGLRGKVSIQLFGLLSTNTIGIIATAAGIWIINILIPAMIGSLFIVGIRLFKNK